MPRQTVGLGRVAIVDGQLLPGFDTPLAEKENPSFARPPSEVRVATVIDEFGSVSADSPVNQLAGAPSNHVLFLFWLELPCLYWADSLPCVLDPPAPGRNVFQCKNT